MKIPNYDKKHKESMRKLNDFLDEDFRTLITGQARYGKTNTLTQILREPAVLDRCFKRRYISKKLEIGELLKVQDHRICRKVSSIPNHPLRANFPETKITRYNLRNKSPAMPAIHTDRFKNTFFNRIVFKYNVAL